MNHRYGVVLLDEREIIFRIYETSEKEWKLFHYHSSSFPTLSDFPEATDIMEIIGNFFSTDYAQHIAEWRMCSRHLPQKLMQEISRALDIPIETITLHREQELLCKGMFTELW